MEFLDYFVLSVMGIIGTIIVTQLLQHNWFQKQRFKFQLGQAKKIDTINIKQLEKKYNLPHGKSSAANTSSSILDLIKNLDSDKLNDLLEALGIGGGKEELEESGGTLETVLKLAMENPEIVGKFLGGVKDKATGGGEQEYI